MLKIVKASLNKILNNKNLLNSLKLIWFENSKK